LQGKAQQMFGTQMLVLIVQYYSIDYSTLMKPIHVQPWLITSLLRHDFALKWGRVKKSENLVDTLKPPTVGRV
jgi:hypothetical protein